MQGAEYVFNEDRAAGYKIIWQNILEAGVLSFSFYAEKVAAIDDNSFVAPQLKRMESEDDAYVYTDVLKILLSFMGFKTSFVATQKTCSLLNTALSFMQWPVASAP